jgi:hypothetical protein
MSRKLGLGLGRTKKVILNDPPVLMEGAELMEGDWIMEDQVVGQNDIDIEAGEEDIAIEVSKRP